MVLEVGRLEGWGDGGMEGGKVVLDYNIHSSTLLFFQIYTHRGLKTLVSLTWQMVRDFLK
jgi:hypothetical protein